MRNPVISDGFAGTCLDCEREGLMIDNEGRKLRYEAFSMGPDLGPDFVSVNVVELCTLCTGRSLLKINNL
jgi:hypothetical protein